MSKTMLDKMNDIIARMESMSKEELETFRMEGEARAKHILLEEYNEDRDFRIVGEENLCGGEVINHQYSMASCNSTYTYENLNDRALNPLFCMAA
jgi:hypothetical protein